MSPVSLGERSPGLLGLIQTLLKLLVQVEHRQAEVVPEFWVASERIGGLFKVLERLQVFLFFEQGEAKVVQDLGGSLRIERADVFVRRRRLLRFLTSCLLLRVARSERLRVPVANHLKLRLFTGS